MTIKQKTKIRLSLLYDRIKISRHNKVELTIKNTDTVQLEELYIFLYDLLIYNDDYDQYLETYNLSSKTPLSKWFFNLLKFDRDIAFKFKKCVINI